MILHLHQVESEIRTAHGNNKVPAAGTAACHLFCSCGLRLLHPGSHWAACTLHLPLTGPRPCTAAAALIFTQLTDRWRHLALCGCRLPRYCAAALAAAAAGALDACVARRHQPMLLPELQLTRLWRCSDAPGAPAHRQPDGLQQLLLCSCHVLCCCISNAIHAKPRACRQVLQSRLHAMHHATQAPHCKACKHAQLPPMV